MNIEDVKKLIEEIKANSNGTCREFGSNNMLIAIDEKDLGRILSLRLAGLHPLQPSGISAVQQRSNVSRSNPPCIMWKLKDAVQIKSELIRQIEFMDEGKELFVYECYFVKAKK